MKPEWINFRIPARTELPENLALTKDDEPLGERRIHYTIAPKDDMPLELFTQSLKVIASRASRVE